MDSIQRQYVIGESIGSQQDGVFGLADSERFGGNAREGAEADEGWVPSGFAARLDDSFEDSASPSMVFAARHVQERGFGRQSDRVIHEIPLQKWLGRVDEVEDETFRARLHAVLGEEGDLEVDVYLEEVDTVDRRLIAPGAEFTWTIGYRIERSGQSRYSTIRFRRLRPWCETELRAAGDAAERRLSALDRFVVDGA